MTLEQVTALAIMIHTQHPTLHVMSMGRYVTTDDFRPDAPWMLSLLVPGFERPRMLRRPEELQQYLPKPVTKAQPQRLRTERELQTSLFD
jgi:hypothetical protein